MNKALHMAWKIVWLLTLSTWASRNNASSQNNIYIYPPRHQQTSEICFMDTMAGDSCGQICLKERLQRFEGTKVNEIKYLNLEPGVTHKMITKALKPPVFEIPNFLTAEECNYIIKRAESTGLFTSDIMDEITGDSIQTQDCWDSHLDCILWANSGECEKNPDFMKKKCRRSCNVCKGEISKFLQFESWDINDDGVLTGYELIRLAADLYFLQLKEEDILDMYRVLSIRLFGFGHHCYDSNNSCKLLASEGECKENPLWMLLNCRESCDNCGCEDLDRECPQLAENEECHASNVEWMMRNCRQSCHVCLGGINKEQFKSLDTTAVYFYMKTLHKRHPRHRTRHSHQAWLHRGSDDVLDRVYRRVENVIKLPRRVAKGGESLQVVKYDTFGHYHAHYDSNPSDSPETSCCHQTTNKTEPCKLCRFITILYYLNDVRGGGETSFVIAGNSTFNETLFKSQRDGQDPYNLSRHCYKANLVITPKRGTAVMWYNHVLDEENTWLGELDQFSLHGGCDVTEGAKWVANQWVPAPYRHDVNTPSIYEPI